MGDSSFKIEMFCKIYIIDSYTGINQKTWNCNFCQNRKRKCIPLTGLLIVKNILHRAHHWASTTEVTISDAQKKKMCDPTVTASQRSYNFKPWFGVVMSSLHTNLDPCFLIWSCHRASTTEVTISVGRQNVWPHRNLLMQIIYRLVYM